MRFWDTSGLVPLLLEQEATREVEEFLAQDPDIAAWWGTPVECRSAAARLRREERLTVGEEDQVLELLDALRASWLEILPSEEVRNTAQRLLRVHASHSSRRPPIGRSRGLGRINGPGRTRDVRRTPGPGGAAGGVPGFAGGGMICRRRPPHSTCMALTGSTRVALLAGRRDAETPATTNPTATEAKVRGSSVPT